MEQSKILKNIKLKNVLGNQMIFLILIIFVVFSALFSPNFATISNISSIISNFSYLVLVAMAMSFVILNGGIDFSVVAVMNIGSVVGAMLINENNGIFAGHPHATLIAVIIMLLIGLAIGALNSFSVVILKMPSFMATMASNLVFSGIAVFLTKSETITALPQSFRNIGSGKVLGIPIAIILTVVAIVLLHVMLSRTSFGRKIYAVGTNHQVARISGVNVKGVITKMFLLSGFFSALSGVVVTAWMGVGRPTLADDMTMDIVAAVVIGGTSTFGGEGKITGTVVGALLIVVMSSSLSLFGLNWYVINAIKGLILLVVALIDAAKRIGK